MGSFTDGAAGAANGAGASGAPGVARDSVHRDSHARGVRHETAVLVVEDDPIVSTLIEHVLTRRGFSVTLASDGQQAREIVEASAPPAVIVLDVMLPFVDGFELVEAIRGQSAWARVPILMLTSKSHENYVVRAFGVGVDDYVVKPFRPEELAARVKRLAGG